MNLRERKKLATREALSAAALRLALEHGPQNVRVEDIAEAAGVSPRTYNNYFSSREQAIVVALAAERGLRVAAALRARPADEPLDSAITAAVLAEYTGAGVPAGHMLSMINSTSAMQTQFLDTVTAIEQPLAAAIAERVDGDDDLGPAVLAAAVAVAARIALARWITTYDSGLVSVTGDGPPLREALTWVAPIARALDAGGAPA